MKSVIEKMKSESSKGEVSFIESCQGRPPCRKGGGEVSKSRRSGPVRASARAEGQAVRSGRRWQYGEKLVPYSLTGFWKYFGFYSE